MSDNIKVVVKVRPLIKREIEDNLTIQWKVRDNSLVQIDQNGKDTSCKFHFDRVYDQNTETSNLYDEIAKPIVEAATAGINGTIFAYGQTSSGKTYTMMGDENSLGIIPLSVYNIFEKIQSIPDRDFLLRVSYIEIYNEKIRDLLCHTKKDIKIHENLQGNIKVDVTEEVTTSPEHVLDLMKQGEGNREIGSTNMNEQSSRSHTIFQIIIESRLHTESGDEGDGYVNVSMLNMVDLAGSERSGQTGATGQRFKEGTHINKSLSSLGLVIKQLSEDQNKFINYRDSKLTRILQNSLGGNAKTSIICAVTPAAIEETISTLQFASRAKAIKNKPEVNAVVTNATMLQALTKKLAALQYELENKKHVEHDNQMLSQRIEELQHKILNGIVTRPERQTASVNRRQTWCAPRRHSISHAGVATREFASSKIPAFITPSLNRYQSDPSAEGRVTLRLSTRGSTIAERDEDDSFEFSTACIDIDMVTPVRKKNVQFNVDQVIELDDSIDEKHSSDGNIRPCSPYHQCYDTSQTPPCVLRENSKHAEKKFKDLLELTEMEKIYAPKEIELYKKLEEKCRQVQTLEIESEKAEQKCKHFESALLDKDVECKVLEAALREKDTQCEEAKRQMKEELVKTKEIIVMTEKKRDVALNENRKEIESLQSKLTDLEFSFDTLKRKSKQREAELLSLLEHSNTRLADVSMMLDSDLKQRSFHFLDVSKDISLVGSDNEMSLRQNENQADQTTPSDQVIAGKLLNEKNRYITDLKRKLSDLEAEIEAVREKHVFTIDKLKKDNAVLQEDLDNSRKDVESYCNVIQDMKKPNVDRSRKETENAVSTSDDIFHIEESVTSNNKILCATIEKFKKVIESKNKEIQEIKAIKEMTDIEYQTKECEISKKAENERIAILENELAQCKSEITEKQTLLAELQRNFESKDSISTKKGAGDVNVESEPDCCKHNVIIEDYIQKIAVLENKITEKENKLEELHNKGLEECGKCQILLEKIVILNQTLTAKDSDINKFQTEIHAFKKTLEDNMNIEKEINLKQIQISNLTDLCTEKDEKISSLEEKITELDKNICSMRVQNEEYSNNVEIANNKSKAFEEEFHFSKKKLEEGALYIEQLESDVQQFKSILKESEDSMACEKLNAEKEIHINNLIGENTELNHKLLEYLDELTKLKAELELQSQLSETLSTCEDRITEMGQELKHKDEEVERLVVENKDLNNKIIDHCDKISEINAKNQETLEELNNIKKLLSSYEIQLSEKNRDIEIIAQSSDIANCEVQKFRENCEVLKGQLADKQKITQDLRDRLETIENDNLKSTNTFIQQLQEYKCLCSELDGNLKDLTAKHALVNNNYEKWQTMKDDYENQLEEKNNEQNRLQANVASCHENLRVELEVQSRLREKLSACEEKITEICQELVQKDQQLEQFKTQNNDLNNKIIEHSNQIRELNIRAQETSDESDKIKLLLLSQEINLSEKSREIEIFTQSLLEAECKVQSLTENCEKLNVQLAEKHAIIQDLELQLLSTQNDNGKITIDLNQQLEEYKSLYSEIDGNLKAITETNEALNKDHEKCQIIINEYENKLQENIMEQNRLLALITSYQKELSDAKKDDLLEQLSEKESNIQDLREQIIAIKNDHFKLTNDLNIELEQYKCLCKENEENLRILTTTTKSLNNDLTECHNQIHNLENQLEENMQEEHRLQTLINTHQKQNKQELQTVVTSPGDESLKQQLSEKENLIIELEEKIKTIENYNITTINELKAALEDLKLLCSEKDANLNSLNAASEIQYKDLTKFSEQINDYENKLQISLEEQNRLRDLISSKENEILNTKEQLQLSCAMRDDILKANSQSENAIIKTLRSQLDTNTNENLEMTSHLNEQLHTYKQLCSENDDKLNVITATNYSFKIDLAQSQATIINLESELLKKNQELSTLSEQIESINSKKDLLNNELIFKDKELKLLHKKSEEVESLQSFTSVSQEEDNMRNAYHMEIESLKSQNIKLQEELLALQSTKRNLSQSIQTSRPTDVLTEENALSDNDKKLIIKLEIDKTKCDILTNVKDVELLRGQLNNLKCKCGHDSEGLEFHSDCNNFQSYTEHLFTDELSITGLTDISISNKLGTVEHSITEKQSTLMNCKEISSNEAEIQKRVDFFYSEIEILKNENEKLKKDITHLIETNVQLLREKEDIGALVKETEELHGRIVWHRTSLCTLTATTHAETKLLKSKLSTLQHKHTRLHIVCERANNEFKVHLRELYQLLQNNPTFNLTTPTSHSYFSPQRHANTFANSTLFTSCSFPPCESICNYTDYQPNLSLDVNNVSVIECPKLVTSILEESLRDDTIIKPVKADADKTVLVTVNSHNLMSAYTQTDDAEVERQQIHNDYQELLVKYRMASGELGEFQKRIDKLSKINLELQVENDSLSNDIMEHIMEFDNLKSELEVYKKKDIMDREFPDKPIPLQTNNSNCQTIESHQQNTVKENIVNNVCLKCLTRNESVKEQSLLSNSTQDLNDSDKENTLSNKFELTTDALEELKKECDSMKNEIHQTTVDCRKFIQGQLLNQADSLQIDTSPLDMIKHFHEKLKQSYDEKYDSLQEENKLIENELRNKNNKFITFEAEIQEKDNQLLLLNKYKISTALQLQELKDECDLLKHTDKEMKDEFFDYVLANIGNADFVDSSERNSSYLHIMKKILLFTADQHKTEIEALNKKIQILYEDKLSLESTLKENCKNCIDLEGKLVSQAKINEQRDNLDIEKCNLLQQLQSNDDKCQRLEATCHELQDNLTLAKEQILILEQAQIALNAKILEYQHLDKDHTLILDRVKGLELEGEKLRDINKVLLEKNEMSIQQVKAYEVLIKSSKAESIELEKKLSQMEAKYKESECILQNKCMELCVENKQKEELIARMQAMQLEHSELQNKLCQIMRTQNELALSQNEFAEARQKLGQANQELYQAKQELDQAKKEISQAKQGLVQAQIQLGQSQQELGQAKRDFDQAEQGYQLKCAEYHTLEERSNEHDTANKAIINRLETENKTLLQKCIEKDDKLMDGQNKLEEIMERCQAFEQQCEECATKLKTAEEQINNYYTLNEILEVRVSDLQSEVDELQRSTTPTTPGISVRRKRQSLHDTVRHQPEFCQEKDELYEQNSKLVGQIEKMRSEAQDIQKLGGFVDDYKKQCANLQDENVKLLQTNETLTRMLKDKESHLEKLNTVKHTLESQVIELTRTAKDQNKPTVRNHHALNEEVQDTDKVVDHKTHNLVLDKNQQLTQCNRDLSQQLQLLKERDNESSEGNLLKEELAVSKQKYEELLEKYNEVDEECEICAKYLREKEAAYDRLCVTKEALEAKVSELQDKLEGEQKHSLSGKLEGEQKHSLSARKKRQSLYDQRRTSAGQLCDVATNTDKEELPVYTNLVDKMTYEAEKDRCRKLQKTVEELKSRVSERTQELRRLQRHQTTADDNTVSDLQQNKEAEQYKLMLRQIQLRNAELEQQLVQATVVDPASTLMQQLQQLQLRNTELEQQLLHATMESPTPAPTLLLAPGSAVVQSQQLCDYVEENYRLKKMNTKLMKFVKGKIKKNEPQGYEPGTN